MFDIGWSEMAVILLVALVVIGPRDLPRVARNVGRWVAKGRAMAREFQSALEDMAREAELDKVKNEIENAGRTNLGKSIEKTIDPTGELGKAFDPNAKSGAKPAKDGTGRPAKALAAKDGKAGAKTEGGKDAAASPPPAGEAAAVKDGKAGAKNAGGPAAGARASSTNAKSPAAGRAGADRGASEPDDAAAGRARAKAPEREAVPADST